MEFEKIREIETVKSRLSYIIAFVISAIISYVIILWFLDVGKIAGNSMYPTLKNGQIEISVKAKYCKIKKGDIVNIDSVVLGESLVKRVIATEGDRVDIKDNDIYINGNRLIEDYIAESDVSYDDYSVVVPKGYYFVMGDNRNNSSDSRNIGCVSRAEIRSKLIYHSK